MDALLVVLMLNTLLSVPAFFLSAGMRLALVIGGADGGPSSLATVLAILGYAVPAFPILSVAGSWLAYWLQVRPAAAFFVVLPWAYFLLTAILMAAFFARAGKTQTRKVK